MSRIVFFCIPAHGHTNPTIGIVNELTKTGHEVRYYSFDDFKEKIEGVNADFVSCDAYLPPAPKDLDKKIGKDFAALIEMVVDTTIALDEKVCSELKEWKPDCIVSDSVCFWGKLFAMKLQIPYVCSTTTFAFNRYTAGLMKKGFEEFILMLKGMPRINRKMKLLREYGYEAASLISIIQNDNETDTIVYTSKKFQPCADTFSDKYSFIGPSIIESEPTEKDVENPLVYISLGTVNNKNVNFYKNCIEALRDCDVQVIMSIGDRTDIRSLKNIPPNFQIAERVNQIQVLQNADVFLSHSGMNSVNESLYHEVPLILFPQQSEQALVANRVVELGAGILLKNDGAGSIKNAVYQILGDKMYGRNAKIIAESFRQSGGSKCGAKAVIKVINS